jgi:Mitochondrial genome maintenance MGM101
MPRRPISLHQCKSAICRRRHLTYSTYSYSTYWLTNSGWERGPGGRDSVPARGLHHRVMFNRAVYPVRTYVALRTRSYALSRPSPVKKIPLAARVNTTQTNSTNGKPETADTTTRDIEADIATSEIIHNTPPESIPSSGALSLPPLLDAPPAGSATDWSRSYHGLSTQPFSLEVANVLQASIDPLDIEIKPGPSSRK